MNRETTEEDNQPATKGDVRQSINRLRSDLITEIEGTEKHLHTKIDNLDTKVSNLDAKIGKLEQGQDAILQTVKSIDEKLKDAKDIPERVKRLEGVVYSPR